MLVNVPYYNRYTDFIRLEISVNTANYNIFTAAGSPVDDVNVELYIHPGVYVYSTVNTTPSITVGTFPVGSVVKIINDGNIVGKGGNGGKGFCAVGCAWWDGVTRDGQAGGHAILTTMNLTIDNTLGNIWAGGGGGGGGGGLYCFCSRGQWMGGDGGGGGAGYNVGTGGLNGCGCYITPCNGSPGTLTTGGNGASCTSNPGGKGGNLGQAGLNGYGVHGWAGVGGPAGKAIKTNGYTVTWEGGNNPTQVIGAVSA